MTWQIPIVCLLLGSTVAVDLSAQELPSGDLADQSLEELAATGLSTPPENLAVTTASKYAQSSRDAPSALRVVTAEDIATYGYRTLAEVLRSLPGVYLTHDRNYTYIGVRGFGRPWDYNSRVLLLIDGVRINENISDGAFLANEFSLDVDLIKRVEFIPGPGSALYGNNAFLGVINVVTQRGNDLNGGELSGSYGSFDTYKARGSYGKRFDNGAEVLLSATGFDREGPDHLYYREFDTQDQNHGVAVGLDYDRGHSAFGKFSWGPLVVEGGYLDRTKGIPTASLGQVFNDKESSTRDQQTFVGLTYRDQLAADWNFYFRLDYHQYDYQGLYPYRTDANPPVRVLNKDLTVGEWWGGELRLVNTSFDGHKWIFGAELQDNLQQSIKNFDAGGETYLDAPYRSTRYGIYFQDEYHPFDSLTLVAGARYDYNPLGGGSANPRLGLIWQASDATTLKLLYGTAFRAPNVTERVNSSDVSIGISNRLAPERIETLELLVEHAFTPSTRFTGTVYHYQVEGLISPVPVAQGYSLYGNADKATATGIELQGEQRFDNGIRTRVSYVWQQAEDQNGGELTNSPHHQLKLNLSAPLWSDQWRAGLETQYLSERRTLNGRVGDYVLSNLSITADLTRNLQLSFGIYNLWNSHFSDPVGPNFVQDSVTQDGRTFRLKLTARY
jgi:iron complex outermembrane receptor protein